jgi:hypothetical protein
VGHVYAVGETPQKAWHRVPYRGLWTLAALAFAVGAWWALHASVPGLPADADSPLVLVPMTAAIVLILLAAFAAYRARMMGRFADEHPEVFEVHPEPSPAEPSAGLFADPLAEPSAAAPEPPAPTRQFCPYCGGRVQADHAFCMFCGKGLPEDDPA